MVPESVDIIQDKLTDFFNLIYKEEVGFVYVALKHPTNSAWEQHFFNWPVEKEKLSAFVLSKKDTHEVYFGPVHYSTSSSAKKSNVHSTRVAWCEFDGNAPSVDSLARQGIPEPSIIVQSSGESNQHWYWCLDEPMEPDVLEILNRALTYNLGADTSGWDSTQILRPPFTFNHKRNVPTDLLSSSGFSYSKRLFNGIELPPDLGIVPLPESLPTVEDVIFKYLWTPQMVTLFREGNKQGDRSAGLMRLGHFCAEAGMSEGESLVVLINADMRWGKFADRPDQTTRLLEIVTRALSKAKSPRNEQRIPVLGLQTFLARKLRVKWLWKGLLQEGGNLFLSGLPGVGKTSLTLDWCYHAALGKPYLDHAIAELVKILFLSLEMPEPDLKYFVEQQTQIFSKEEIEVLEKNLLFLPVGEPMYLNHSGPQHVIDELVGDLKVQGIVIDSLGSAAEGELSNEGPAKALLDWNDRFRRKHDIFTWYIHHNRKPSGDNKKPNKLADLFGSQYFGARATTVITLWDGSSGLELLPLKIRLAKREGLLNISRDSALHFTRRTESDIIAEGSDSSSRSLQQPKGRNVTERSRTLQSQGFNNLELPSAPPDFSKINPNLEI